MRERLDLDTVPRRIVIYRALFLGDLLLTIPAFRALRQGFPEAEISLIGLPWAAEFVERVPYLDRFVPFVGYPGIMEVPVDPQRTESFLADARATGYDIAIQMHGNGEVSNGFVAALGAGLSLGFRNGPDARLDQSLPYDPEEHELLRWLRLVRQLGIPGSDTRIDFALSEREVGRAAELLQGCAAGAGSRIGLHAGAKDPARRWPPHCFAELADALVRQYGAQIVLTGSQSERSISDVVQHAMGHSAVDLVGQTDLGTFAALLGELDLLVTNDTGASHLASAVGTRSVVLFGPSRPSQWGPLDQQRHRAVDALVYAWPQADPVTALARLPVAPVLEACRRQLESVEVECSA